MPAIGSLLQFTSSLQTKKKQLDSGIGVLSILFIGVFILVGSSIGALVLGGFGIGVLGGSGIGILVLGGSGITRGT